MLNDVGLAHGANLSMLKCFVNHANAMGCHAIGMQSAPVTIGDRIRVTRESKGLDLAPVAKAAGISVSALSQIETGVTKQPKPETLFKLSDALDVDARYLVFGHHDRVAASLAALRVLDSGRYRIRKSGS
jgi:DNA-binding XRE family transcriptional regulator